MHYKYPDGGYAKHCSIKQTRSHPTELVLSCNTSVTQPCTSTFKTISKQLLGSKTCYPQETLQLRADITFLVDKKDFQQIIQSHLMIAIAKWHDDFVEPDAKPPDGFFPGPPCVKPIADDGMSSGKNSWMSMSNASFLSMDLSMVQNNDYFMNSQTANKTFSYAHVVILPKGSPTINQGNNTHYDNDEQKETFSDITGTHTLTTNTAYKRTWNAFMQLKTWNFKNPKRLLRTNVAKLKQ